MFRAECPKCLTSYPEAVMTGSATSRLRPGQAVTVVCAVCSHQFSFTAQTNPSFLVRLRNRLRR